ncbi:MAG: hydroxyethylthiazole kinase [Burkholderiaceae bacterium]|jgi:hydroxyethylthiazole kinase|nr:hydroxyethylthiazole kinase [Burkholderiaceae bacterium]
MTLTVYRPAAEAFWEDISALRQTTPLIHNITNQVVAPYNANVLLAFGAAPVMAHAHEEVADMATLANALILNIGTLDPYRVDAMKIAMSAAIRAGKPVVLDPVGAGATPYRTETACELIALGPPSIIRGNASEIMSLTGLSATTRGVESAISPDAAIHAARKLARQIGGVVCVSGKNDHVVDHTGRWLTLSNGHEWMTRVTGTGCAASAMTGAVAAVQHDYWRATASAMAYLGVAGEMAAENVIRENRGLGSFQAALLDYLQLLPRETFISKLALAHRG